MKKIQMLLAIAAFVVAGASVYAGNTFATSYRVWLIPDPNEASCPGTANLTTLPCAIGTATQCTASGMFYTYRETPDGGTESGCKILKKD